MGHQSLCSNYALSIIRAEVPLKIEDREGALTWTTCNVLNIGSYGISDDYFFVLHSQVPRP